ncbi:hypothetical protein [Granulicella sp. S156]|uniref:hypothetical protein n=1 Tax=Granulicella sp. S156 TaxID=1747224 RepID=UPI00131C92AA|nr:hypothetical protein [Granulicella sp. S156]
MLKKVKLIYCAGLLGLSTYSMAYAQTIKSQAALVHPDWVQIPGELIRPECVHEIPNGAKVETVEGKITGDVTVNGALLAHYEPCTEEAVATRHPSPSENRVAHTPGLNGWVEAAQWDDTNQNVDLIYGNWTVPSNPSENGGLIYLFNGLEPSVQTYILQPVLQYGSGYAGGGNYWAIASWLVGTNYVFHSPLETVNPGDSLFGYTEVTGTSGSTLDWRVEGEDETTGAYSWITTSTSGLEWSWAYAAVLEAYGISSCSQLPANLHDTFTGTEVYQGTTSYTLETPGWYGAIYDTGGLSCGFGVGVSGTTSTVYY